MAESPIDSGMAASAAAAAAEASVAPPRGACRQHPSGSCPSGVHLTLLVIGKVTHNSARVLVEVLEGGRITAHLTQVKTNVRQLDDSCADPTAPVTQAEPSSRQDAAPASAAAAASVGRDITAPVTTSTRQPGEPHHVLIQDLMPGRPRIFHFTGLDPNARYAVSFDNLTHAQPDSSFVTLMEGWKCSPDYPPFRIASVSCNLLSETLALKPEQVDLWQDLADRIGRGEVDYVLHIGDQVYADEPRSNDSKAPQVSAFAPDVHEKDGKGGEKLEKGDQLVFKKCLKLLEEREATTPDQYRALYPAIEELYRELYRETWSHPPTARVLANVPNLTVLDDHDFVDNWGTLPEHHDPNTKEFSIGLCARQIYFEYQVALHRDVNLLDVPSIQDDHHFHVFGEYGIAFTESRGAQSFRYETDKSVPFLGVRQWADLEAALGPGGVFDKVRHLIMVCPCPLVYLPHGLNALAEPAVEDAQGHWASKPFRPEQTRMLNLCLAWQEGRDFVRSIKDTEAPKNKPACDTEQLRERGVTRIPYVSIVGRQLEDASPSLCTSDRRLTLLGGDVHVGGHTRIFKHNHLVLEQLVSSAIANHIIPSMAFNIASMLQNTWTDLEDEWSFQHQPFHRERNYGLITTKTLPGHRKPGVVTSIVAAKEEE